MPDLPRAGAVRVGRGVAGRAPLHAVAVGAVTGLIVVGSNLAYLVIGVLTWRSQAIRLMERAARVEQEKRTKWPATYLKAGGPLVTRYERTEALVAGFWSGAAWPIYWLIWLTERAVKRVLRFDTWQAPSERARLDRLELDRLRKLAAEHGLVMPEDDRG